MHVAVQGDDRSLAVEAFQSLVLSALVTLDVLPQSLNLDSWEFIDNPAGQSRRTLLAEGLVSLTGIDNN